MGLGNSFFGLSHTSIGIIGITQICALGTPLGIGMCRTLVILFCAIEVAVAIVGCDVGTSVVPAAGCGGAVPSSNTRYQTTCPGVCVSTSMFIVGGFHC